MTKAKFILATVAAIALVPAMASAQHAPYNVLNGQVQLNDAIATLNVQFGSATGVTANGAAAGNSMSAKTVEREMNVTNDQYLRGTVAAVNQIAGGAARGHTVSTAVAAGNSAQVQGCCAVTRTGSQQVAVGGTKVAAISLVRVGSADRITSGTQASGNSFASHTANGSSRARVGQYSSAEVHSHSKVEACCNNGSVTSGAVAAGNAARWGGESATIYAGVDQKNYGDVYSSSVVNIKSATNVTSAASAAGNVAEIQNQWGYAQMDGYQENKGRVDAKSAIHLNDFGGHAVSGANAIGNSALVSNLGSDVTMSMTQNNFGPVSASASLMGNSFRGGVAQASSTAVGNAITGYSCASCGQGAVKVEGYSNQYNSGSVTASTFVGMGTAGHINASATAVGNSASYIAQRSH